MAEDVVLQGSERTATGRGAARKVRASGALPAVMYGVGGDAVTLSVERHALIRALHKHGAHPLVTVRLDGRDVLALVKEVQVDVVRQEALHVDFLRVDENRPVQTEVPLVLTGEATGVRYGGGVLEAPLRAVTIETLPRNIPESISLDVSHLEVGSSLRVSDLQAPGGVTIMTDGDEIVALVSAPRVEAEPAVAGEEPEEGAEAAEGEEAAEAADGERAEAEES